MQRRNFCESNVGAESRSRAGSLWEKGRTKAPAPTSSPPLRCKGAAGD